jgi:hypothetical protein
MRNKAKNIEALTKTDLEAYPVWRYLNDDRSGETKVRPVKRIHVTNLGGKLAGTRVRLANGNFVWALIGNVDSRNPQMTKHFLTLSLQREGKWFTLSRYHDFDYSQNGPASLASFLGLDVDQVFPICYDITHCAIGDIEALRGEIPKEPHEKLTRAQIIAMAVP